MRRLGILLLLAGGAVSAQSQPPPAAPPFVPVIAPVKPIDPPPTPLPDENATAHTTAFSFIAYGDTRCDCTVAKPAEDETAHAQVVDQILATVKARASTPNPIRFVLQSGDATFRGPSAERWPVFVAIIEKMTKGANLPYFFAVGNHDVTGMPPGDPGRALGLHYTLSAIAKLIPPEGSPHRLNGYPTYAFGYGNSFFIALDSNIASDTVQLAWVTNELEHLDRARYTNVFAFYHHPLFSSGPHSGVQPIDPRTHQRGPDRIEPQTLAMRTLYAPLFRKYHVRMTLAGHDHLFDHWVERYVDGGRAYRRDDVLTGGGGAPTYTYQGEPDLQAYVSGGADAQVRLEHLAKPGPKIADNPHHFAIVDVDGEKLTLEIVAVGGVLAPYGGKTKITLNN
ncbi:MAG TPA: metallophosphoesterase [Vicinamibacterales bacterium]|nr:metallophosphoesterase [Vicinamibacterales bacterium]